MHMIQRLSMRVLTKVALLLATITTLSALTAFPALAAPFAYITNSGSNSVSVIDTRTSSVVATVPVSAQPVDVAITPDGKLAYVTIGGDNSVAVIDTMTNTVVASVPVGAAPRDISITPDGKFAYVIARLGTTSIALIDTKSNTVVARVQVGGDPTRSFLYDLAVAPSGKFMYVSVAGEGVWMVDTATNTQVTLVQPRISEPFQIAFTPNSNLAYVSTQFGIVVWAINTPTNTVTAVVRVSGSHCCDTNWVAVSPDGQFAYVVGLDSNFTVINTATNTVEAALRLGFGGSRVAITPNGKLAYVLNRIANAVAIVDTNNLTLLGTQIPVGLNPVSLAITPFAFPETSVLDNFNRSSFKLGPDWSGDDNPGSYRIKSDQVDVRHGGEIYWQPTSFGVDQEAFVTLTKIDPDGIMQGVVLKAQGASPAATPKDKYGAISVTYNAKKGAVYVRTILPRADDWTSYPPVTVTFGDGDQFGAQVHSNGNVAVFRNHKLIGTVTLTSTDQKFFNHNGGRIGLEFSRSADDALFDDFGGGSLTQ